MDPSTPTPLLSPVESWWSNTDFRKQLVEALLLRTATSPVSLVDGSGLVAKEAQLRFIKEHLLTFEFRPKPKDPHADTTGPATSRAGSLPPSRH